jgi:hypothetical protein
VSCAVRVEVPGLPTTVILPVPSVLILLAVGPTGPPEFPVRVLVTAPPVKLMTTVSPAPEVVISVPPRIFNVFATGTAVPASVTKLVGMAGLPDSLRGPA